MARTRIELSKSPTGIQGLDEITCGGFPTGRPTLICGSAGCGKTLLAMEFLVRGATQFSEPGVFMAFDETAEDLTKNVASLGFDLRDLVARKKIVLDDAYREPGEMETSGEYDLDGLFLRLGLAIDSIGAKRVVLDTIGSLFSGLPDPQILRAELRRLVRWLKDKGVTAVVTGERGESALTRQGLEEYVSDCVIVLEHRVSDQVSSRRLRVVKYRGSTHGTNKYPFLIGQDGISVLPIPSLGLQPIASTARIPAGIPRLGTMLSGAGYNPGGSASVPGTAGAGKASLAMLFAVAACQRGERALYFTFEESSSRILPNMRSVGIDLEPWVRSGLLRFITNRPAFAGLEMHVTTISEAILDFKPQVVIIDPLTTFTIGNNETEVKAMVMQLVDLMKMNRCTTLFTSLVPSDAAPEQSQVSIASLIDTWPLLRGIEMGRERDCGITPSNPIREFLLTERAVELRDAYAGPSGVVTGSAQLAQEKDALAAREQEVKRRQTELELKRRTMEAQIAAMRAEFDLQEAGWLRIIGQEQAQERNWCKSAGI